MKIKKFDLDKLVRNNVKLMSPYSSARDEFTGLSAEMVFIDANENPFQNGLNRYPDPHQNELKEKLATVKKIKKEQILLGNGSDEVLDLIYRAFCEPKSDNVILMPPTYGMYKVLANLNGVYCKEVLLTSGFQLNVSEIIDQIDENTKLIFVCSPNNPTGNEFLEEDIEMILKIFNGIVVIDEAYIDFSNGKSWLTKLIVYSNLIVTQTFSKAYGMASIRLGICYASLEIINILNKIKPPYNVNILTQNAALQKLDDMGIINQQIDEINKNKYLLINELKNIKFIQDIFPSQANFILVRVDDAKKRYDELLMKGIVARNRTKEPLCENCLRFTIGTGREVSLLINTLKQLT